jgi:hypothetical protein
MVASRLYYDQSQEIHEPVRPWYLRTVTMNMVVAKPDIYEAISFILAFLVV